MLTFQAAICCRTTSWLSLRQRLELALSATHGLAYLHEMRVVHFDLVRVCQALSVLPVTSNEGVSVTLCSMCSALPLPMSHCAQKHPCAAQEPG